MLIICPRARNTFQHTAARRRLQSAASAMPAGRPAFQHTAARRRLPSTVCSSSSIFAGFNTQPPECGCVWSAGRGLRRTGFQHTAARRRLHPLAVEGPADGVFQHTAARRRLLSLLGFDFDELDVSTHSRPKAAAHRALHRPDHALVSTHSRPKAAATADGYNKSPGSVSTPRRPKAAATAWTSSLPPPAGFNTQPPEGGCQATGGKICGPACFNTQPPEGGCRPVECIVASGFPRFNTQPPEGGCRTKNRRKKITCPVSTHSRPKAAARSPGAARPAGSGFNTQPPEGGCAALNAGSINTAGFQHTAARRRLRAVFQSLLPVSLFQHTAARRRLRVRAWAEGLSYSVSTHSRPKAAAKNHEKTYA